MKTFLAIAAVLSLAQAPPLTKAEQFQEAARKGDAAAVRKLIDEGVDVNTKYRYGATALFYATDHGHVEVVKVLLEKGAAMDLKDTFYGFTPLALALSPAQKKRPEHTEIAKLLIAKGAPGKSDALASAIRAGDTSLAQVILDSGGLPAAALSDALETARAQNKPDLAAMLEKAGAKPNEAFPIDPAHLAKLAGTYKNANNAEITVVVAGSRLTIGPASLPPEQRLVLAAKDATTFRALGGGGMTASFTVEGDKVTSFTINPPQGTPQLFTRVEGK